MLKTKNGESKMSRANRFPPHAVKLPDVKLIAFLEGLSAKLLPDKMVVVQEAIDIISCTRRDNLTRVATQLDLLDSEIHWGDENSKRAFRQAVNCMAELILK